MKRLIAFASVLFLGLASQIAHAQVSTDYDRTVDFGQYKTFTFAKPSVKVRNPLYSSPLLMQRIQDDLTQELTKRGMVRQPTKADLLVKVHTYTEDKTRTVYNTPAYGPFLPYRWGFSPYRFGFMPYWGGYYGGWNQAYQQQYTQGTLLVDLIDSRTNQLVWRSAVQGVVDSTNRLDRRVARGVRKMMKDYPVKAS